MDGNVEGNDNPGGAAFEEFVVNENVANNNNDNNNNEVDEGENENDAGGGNNNNNMMIDIDLEEDEEDGNNDSTYDGGVAINPDVNRDDAASKAKKHSSECDLVRRAL